jgi:hypothetical protein
MDTRREIFTLRAKPRSRRSRYIGVDCQHQLKPIILVQFGDVNNTEHGISRKIDNVGTITSARQVANELIGSSSIINAPKTPKHLRHEVTQPSGITPKDIVASTTHGKQSNHGPKVQLFKHLA